MTSKQYEELCRFFLAEQFQIGIDRVVSVDLLNPRRPGQPPYAHQIDLYWEIELAAVRYVHIANAKWRTPPHQVVLGEVLMLQQVKNQLAAHKAVLLTNVGFDEGALAAAADQGIALHVVRPGFDTGRLHPWDAGTIRGQLQSLARMTPAQPLYVHDLLRKSFALPGSATVVERASQGGQLDQAVVRPAIGPLPSRAGGAPAAPSAGVGGFSYQTKQGPGPGWRRK